jgi:AraC-like DNA-binding protein
MDLIWTGAELVLAGPDTVAQLVRTAAGTAYAAIRFAPGTGPAVAGLPGAEVRDQRVPIGQLWSPAAVREATDALAEAADPGAALERIAAARLAASPADPAAPVIAGLAGRGATVAQMARRLGIGERHLHRRSLAAFGYGPKTLGRILRFGRALALARTGQPLAVTAAGCGYADQSHLAREARDLAGVPMTELLLR